jgi:hypothetical protein
MRDPASLRLIARPTSQFLYLVATLLAFAMAFWLAFIPRPPWWYYFRARELGWVPIQWNEPLVGHWTSRFEQSSFVPCPHWAANVADARGALFADVSTVQRRLTELAWAGHLPRQDTTVFVAWYADISDTGGFGHLSQYRQALGVRELGTVRPRVSGDCVKAVSDPDLFPEY